jgi:hypothetical protein
MRDMVACFDARLPQAGAAAKPGGPPGRGGSANTERAVADQRRHKILNSLHSNLRPSRRRLLLAHIAVFEPIRLAIIIDGKLEQALSKFSIEDFTGKLAKSRCLFP